MSRLTFDTPHGRLRVEGWCKDTMADAAELGRELAREGRAREGWIAFEGTTARLRARPLGAGARLGHGLRHWLLSADAPCVREYKNLSWLIERHFQAVLPLAAGVFLRAGWPVFEFLLTRREPGATSLASTLERADRRERRDLLQELARELGRMHALGFWHGRLDGRTLLVRPAGRGRRFLFSDAGCGGPRPHGKPYEVDLARLLAHVPLAGDEGQALLDHYRAQRAAQDRGVARGHMARRLARAQARFSRAAEPGPT